MIKCQIYPCDEALWAFQPFGPSENIAHMAMLGSHYRGFPVIKIGDEARQMIEAGREVQFTYKRQRYVAVNGEVKPINFTAVAGVDTDGKRILVVKRGRQR